MPAGVTVPARRELIFSFNCFAAAMLALFASFALGLERPFWAMMTVYITSQPLSGAVRSKAVFRLAGTVLGAAATVILMPPLANSPVLLSLALAAWVGLCQFVSLLDRTPRSYLFLLAGYTAALIGFPSVGHPETVFDTAVLRAEEIGIGVICAAFVHAVIFPRSVTPLLAARAGTLLAEAESWIADALSLHPPARTARERRRMAADVTELHIMATHIPFDTAARRPTRALLAALRQRFALMLPLVSAIEDRMHSLGTTDGIADELAAVRALAAGEGDAADTRARCLARAHMLPLAGWDDLVRLNLLHRLAELADALEDARALTRSLAAPTAHAVTAAPASAPAPAPAGAALHRDFGLAGLSALATLVATLGCCALWIATAWPEGAVAAMIAAVVCCLFSTMDDPLPAQRSFLIWTIISLPIAALYLFAILPRVTDPLLLVLVLAPVMLPIGAFMALPRWYGRALPLAIGLIGGLALTNRFASDFAGFVNGGIAQLVGVAAAMAATRLFRSLGAGVMVRRLRAAGRRDLAALRDQHAPAALARWIARMLDRVGLIAARLGDVTDDRRDEAAAALRELRLGITLAQFEGGPAGTLRADIAAHVAGQRDAAPLLARLDDAIDSAWRDRARPLLAALAGLRRNAFPDAPAWAPAHAS